MKRKTKALISCAVTAQLICIFVFSYAIKRFSHNEAHICTYVEPIPASAKCGMIGYLFQDKYGLFDCLTFSQCCDCYIVKMDIVWSSI